MEVLERRKGVHIGMQTRQELYELIRYADYERFDQEVAKEFEKP